MKNFVRILSFALVAVMLCATLASCGGPAKDPADAVADEIAASLENLIGSTDEPAPKAAPQNADSINKFSDLSKHFGSDYNPTAK